MLLILVTQETGPILTILVSLFVLLAIGLLESEI